MHSRIQIGLAILIGLAITHFFPDAACAGVPQETPPDLLLTPREAVRSDAMSHFAWGFLLQLQGRDAEECRKHYLNALRLAPDSAAILEHSVMHRLLERDFDNLIADLSPIAAEHPEIAQLHLVLSRTLNAQGKTEESIELLEKAFARSGWGELQLFRELFAAHWREKRYDDIRELLRNVRRNPSLRNSFLLKHASAVYFNALAHLPEGPELSGREQRRLLRRALRHARSAASLVSDADRVEDVESLADIFIAHEAWQDAADLLERVRDAKPFPVPGLVLRLAQVLAAMERPDDALALLGDFAASDSLEPVHLVDVAALYFDMERLEESASFYERALLSWPHLLGVRLRLGYLYLRLDRAERNLELLGKVPKLPAEGHFLVSHAYRQLGRTQEAAKALAEAEAAAVKEGKQDFFTVDFYLYFATLCEDLGHTERSLEKAAKALELDPADPVSANFMGYVLADHNRDLPAAEKWVQLALGAEPDNYAYVDSLAWVYFRQQRYGEALVAINRALRLSGREPDPVILDHAGDICAANGLWLLAEKHWREALVSGATTATEIREKLEQIPASDR